MVVVQNTSNYACLSRHIWPPQLQHGLRPATWTADATVGLVRRWRYYKPQGSRVGESVSTNTISAQFSGDKRSGDVSCCFHCEQEQVACFKPSHVVFSNLTKGFLRLQALCDERYRKFNQIRLMFILAIGL